MAGSYSASTVGCVSSYFKEVNACDKNFLGGLPFLPNIHDFFMPSPVGAVDPVPDQSLEVFQFFTPELLDMMVTETNRYARQALGPAEWREVDKGDLQAFLGFNLLMGLNPKPCV